MSRVDQIAAELRALAERGEAVGRRLRRLRRRGSAHEIDAVVDAERARGARIAALRAEIAALGEALVVAPAAPPEGMVH